MFRFLYGLWLMIGAGLFGAGIVAGQPYILGSGLGLLVLFWCYYFGYIFFTRSIAYRMLDKLEETEDSPNALVMLTLGMGEYFEFDQLLATLDGRRRSIRAALKKADYWKIPKLTSNWELGNELLKNMIDWNYHSVIVGKKSSREAEKEEFFRWACDQFENNFNYHIKEAWLPKLLEVLVASEADVSELKKYWSEIELPSTEDLYIRLQELDELLQSHWEHTLKLVEEMKTETLPASVTIQVQGMYQHHTYHLHQILWALKEFDAFCEANGQRADEKVKAEIEMLEWTKKLVWIKLFWRKSMAYDEVNDLLNKGLKVIEKRKEKQDRSSRRKDAMQVSLSPQTNLYQVMSGY